MTTVPAGQASDSLHLLLKQVNEENSAIRITSNVGNAVLVSEREFGEWQTTMHLFSTSANARRLTEAIERSSA